MNARFVAAALAACQIFISSSPLFAQEEFGLLTPAQKRAYHACLYGSFIDNHCWFHAWGSSAAAYRECVIANYAARIPPGPYWGLGINDVCRALVQTQVF
jgi:hypothetical protein